MSKNKSSKLSSKDLRVEIIKVQNLFPGKVLSAGFIKKHLNIDNNKESIRYAQEKIAEGTPMVEPTVEKHETHSSHFIKGKVDMTKRGDAFIICEDYPEDIFVQGRRLRGAMDNDIVEVRLSSSTRSKRPEGEVINVLERGLKKILGTLYFRNGVYNIKCDYIDLPFPVVVNPDQLNGAKHKERVIAEIIEWPEKHQKIISARITGVLGETGSIDLAMTTILVDNGFDISFPEEAVIETEKMSDKISAAELKERRDMRDVLTFTIDPEDAKDFDDAISYEKLENDQIRIGIHIADVAHYVQPNTALDKEAYLRSTSVYLTDRVCPMLPEKISNELCSLRPNEDKRTFSAVFTFDSTFKIIERWFGRSLIHSDRRFTYEEAQVLLDNPEGSWGEVLQEVDKIALQLRKKRFQHGAIAFETEEVRYKFNAEGMPVSAFVKSRQEANMLIEDLMLLANREVASYIARKSRTLEIPFVYRIHDQPSVEKLADLALFAKDLGFEFNMTSPKAIISSYNHLAEQSQKNEHLKMLQPLAIRTMAKAVYSTVNIGHYGLGFQFYCHFTSPIRRYSDVLTHRILFDNLKGSNRVPKEELEQRCKHISTMERKAVVAERESTKYTSAVYMNEKVGQIFEGHISGIIERGIFVLLDDSLAEGLIEYDSLYEKFDVAPHRLTVTGRRTNITYRMGDPVLVKIMKVDIETREIDMVLVDKEGKLM